MTGHIQRASQGLEGLPTIPVTHKNAVPEGIVESLPVFIANINHGNDISAVTVQRQPLKFLFVIVIAPRCIHMGRHGSGIPLGGVRGHHMIEIHIFIIHPCIFGINGENSAGRRVGQF
ncbi:hypothetical protein FQZ97_1027760 [compost metagenome]